VRTERWQHVPLSSVHARDRLSQRIRLGLTWRL
jgi:hypothetical protein